MGPSTGDAMGTGPLWVGRGIVLPVTLVSVLIGQRKALILAVTFPSQV